MAIMPYGGKLVNKVVPDSELADMLKGIDERVALSQHDIINLQNIAIGCYSPINGFMTEKEYNSVILYNKLPEGPDWTIPILLRVESKPRGNRVALCDQKGMPLAVLNIESVFGIDKEMFCRQVLGTTSADHPGVRQTMEKPAICIGGEISLSVSGINRLRHFGFPAEMREWMRQTGKETFTAFSTRNICHIGHEYLHSLALETSDMLGINIITGAEIKGNFLPDVVFDTYEHILSRFYPEERVFLNNLRLPPIYAGPKEAFLQAVILQNYGFTHFIIGRDHAGIGEYYPKYGSQRIFNELKDPDIRILPFAEPRFCRVCGRVTTEKSCRHGSGDIIFLNGRDVRRYLAEERHKELEMILNRDVQKTLTEMFKKTPEVIFL